MSSWPMCTYPLETIPAWSRPENHTIRDSLDTQRKVFMFSHRGCLWWSEVVAWLHFFLILRNHHQGSHEDQTSKPLLWLTNHSEMPLCFMPITCHWGKGTGVDHRELELNQELAILAWGERGRIPRRRKKKSTGKFSVFFYSRYFINYSWVKGGDGEKGPTLFVRRHLVYSPSKGGVTRNGGRESSRVLVYKGNENRTGAGVTSPSVGCRPLKHPWFSSLKTRQYLPCMHAAPSWAL